MNLEKCDKCGNRNIMCFLCENNKHYRETKYSHNNFIRNKAIDEFTKEIRDWQIDIQDNEYDADKFDFVFERIFEIAEEMKGGATDERT